MPMTNFNKYLVPKPIDEQLNNPDRNHRHYLDLTVHHNSLPAEHMQFCSWVCVIKKLPTLKTDYFIVLPFLTFDNKLEQGIRAKDFFTAIEGTETCIRRRNS